MGQRLSTVAPIFGGEAAEPKEKEDQTSAEILDELTVLTPYTVSELKQLRRLFQTIDTDGSGLITSNELLMVPQLEHNPLGRRVVERFTTKRSHDTLSFKDFVLSLAVFAPDAPYEQKLRLAFEIFDFDGDQKIGRSDLEALLRALLPEDVDALPFSEKVPEGFVPVIADRILEEADLDADGVLNYEEFAHAVAHSDIRAKLTFVF